MAKLAVKTNKKILDKNVFLERACDGEILFGKLNLKSKKMSKKDAIGIITENLIQDDITINYKTDFEKLKIISCIPGDFRYNINTKTKSINVIFDKTVIKANLFKNKEYIEQDESFLTCFDEEKSIIKEFAIKTPDLKEKINKMNNDILKVKKSLYPNEYISYEDSKNNLKNYIIYLLENNKIQVIKSSTSNSLSQYRRFYNNEDSKMYSNFLKENIEDVEFSFIFDNKIYDLSNKKDTNGNYILYANEFEKIYKSIKMEGTYEVK